MTFIPTSEHVRWDLEMLLAHYKMQLQEKIIEVNDLKDKLQKYERQEQVEQLELIFK